MLHELSHIVHSEHDSKFHALWNQLRDEHEALLMKGYTGEGFLSEGHRLGGSGRQRPMDEARRLAGAAADKRNVLSGGSGRRLGGAAPRSGADIRRVIASATERRLRTLQGCGNTNHNEKEIREISDSASRNGFKTQAEEDAANEAAIAQALWELVQEDEKAKYGSSYVPPSAEHPEGSQGGAAMASARGSSSGPSMASRPKPNGGPRIAGPSSSTNTPPPIPLATKPPLQSNPTAPAEGWACIVCTLHNPADFLCCDACGIERSKEQTKQTQQKKTAKRPRDVVDLTSSPTSKPGKKAATRSTVAAPSPPKAATWQCSFCGNVMETLWWTCSTCGKMKDSS